MPFWRKKKKVQASKPIQSEPTPEADVCSEGEAIEELTEESQELEPAVAQVAEALQGSLEQDYGFGDLRSFGLVQKVGYYCKFLHDIDGPREPLLDQVLQRATAEAILKLDEADVPREIAGQRLAAVFTHCQEAVSWEHLPGTCDCARRFLDREDNLGVKLAQELGLSQPEA